MHCESIYHAAFHMFFISFSLRFAFQCIFSPSHKTDNKPSPPSENAGHDARGEEESLVAVSKIAAALTPSQDCYQIIHRALERYPTDPHAFFVDII